MQIGIIGYGKMGKTIEQIVLDRGNQVAVIVDKENLDDLDKKSSAIDVAIEFSTPETAVTNIKRCIDRGIPVVVGTTGWMDALEEVETYTREHQGALFYASNFSLGVNIFFRLNEWLAAIMNRYPAYQVKIDETHHVHKLDKPSGTALSLAEGLTKELSQYDGWSLDTIDQKNKLPIFSHRKGEVPGTHSVSYESSIDELSIQHIAHGREGFAMGAVLVAEWLAGKKGVYTMNDFLNF